MLKYRPNINPIKSIRLEAYQMSTMKKRIPMFLLALAMMVVMALPAFADSDVTTSGKKHFYSNMRGQYLNLEGNGAAYKNRNVTVYTYTNDDDQYWYIQNRGNGVDQLLRQRYAAHTGTARLGNNRRHHALHDRKHRQHQLQPIRHRTLCQCKTDKQLEGVFRLFDLDKAAAGFHNAHSEKQNQQPIANRLQSAVNAGHHAPDLPALECLRAFGQQRPNLRQLVIPCGERGI